MSNKAWQKQSPECNKGAAPQKYTSQPKSYFGFLRSDPPALSAADFFSAPAWSKDSPGVANFLAAMERHFGPDLVPVIKRGHGHYTMSAYEQYEAWLTSHDAYRKFDDAEYKIISHNREQLGDFLRDSILIDLGTSDGVKAAHLCKAAARPRMFWGIDINGDSMKPLRQNLGAVFERPRDVVAVRDDFCQNAFWQSDIWAAWDKARKELNLPRKVFSLLGLTDGNLNDDELSVLFANISGAMGRRDLFLVANDATGTHHHALSKKKIAQEIRDVNSAYSPPGIGPYCHYAVFSSMRLMKLAPFDHFRATAVVGMNKDKTMVERKLVFDSPQIVRGHSLSREMAEIKEIHMPGSRKRSLKKLRDLAKQGNLKIVATLPDPTRATRIAIAVLAKA